ncbi:MAG: hypothetical protein RSE41_00090 [Clostridia bacterium]
MKTDILIFYSYIDGYELFCNSLFLEDIELPIDYNVNETNINEFILSLTDKLNDKEDLTIIEMCEMKKRIYSKW